MNVTFREPANPSDSVKKYANGIATKSDIYEPRNIWFHIPVREGQKGKLWANVQKMYVH